MTDDSEPRPVDRRAFLAACGATALAGCAAGSGDTDGEPASAAGTATRTETRTATPADELDLGEPEAWPMAGYDARNTGHNPAANGPTATPTDGWGSDVTGYKTMSAGAFYDGRLYLGSGETGYGFDPRDGYPDWTVSLEYSPNFTAPAVAAADGVTTTYLATRSTTGAIRGGGDGRLLAVTADGGRRWARDLPVTGSAKPVGDRLYVPSSTRETGRLHALSPTDGTTVWEHTVSGDRTGVFGAPAVANRVVYAPVTQFDGETATAELRQLSVDDGTRRRGVTFPGEFRARPVVDKDGTVYVTTRSGVVAAVADEVAWETQVDGEIWATPVLVDEQLVVLAGRRLVAFDTTTGGRQWTVELPPTRGSELATDGETVYVGGNRLTAVAVADGTKRWAEPIPGGNAGGWGSPVVAGEALFVGVCVKNGENGGLYDDRMRLLV
ncbi:PQQ-binding-like beta-propeller repeat protein [Halobaculum sp. MBLA0143]|uniref:outer membrane protein assembly factor BamB family protein n=1 Tax=Halobaculum sp. MBLA0143 TaxID=3079933 RepID=UPI00352397C5